jgi:hypothetical protein
MKLYDIELEDLRRELLRFRFDPQYKGRDRRVPIWGFAGFVGISRVALYKFMSREQEYLRPRTKARILHGLALVRDGMRWRRRNRLWQPFMPDGSLPLPPGERVHDHHPHL